MSIPLVQNNEKDSINTSIIAIKRNIERINMLLGLSNSEEIDTSKFATKEELQQAVTDLQPVDEVAVDNMHSVSSNAVAGSLSYSTTEHKTGGKWIDGKDIYSKAFYATSADFPLATGITNLDKMLDIRATIKDSYGNYSSVPMYSAGGYTSCYFYPPTGALYFEGSIPMAEIYVIFEYTKTTG